METIERRRAEDAWILLNDAKAIDEERQRSMQLLQNRYGVSSEEGALEAASREFSEKDPGAEDHAPSSHPLPAPMGLFAQTVKRVASHTLSASEVREKEVC